MFELHVTSVDVSRGLLQSRIDACLPSACATEARAVCHMLETRERERRKRSKSLPTMICVRHQFDRDLEHLVAAAGTAAQALPANPSRATRGGCSRRGEASASAGPLSDGAPRHHALFPLVHTQAAASDGIDFLIGCQWDSAAQQLWLLAGEHSGSVHLLHVNADSLEVVQSLRQASC